MVHADHRTASTVDAGKDRINCGEDRLINDNALAQMLNGLFKALVIHRLGPRRSVEAIAYATLE